MLKLAVIGKDVSKSDSPKMHTFIANSTGREISYDAISIPEDKFDEWIDGVISRYDGFNVTIPYKLAVMPKLKTICDDAVLFGAVNTVKSADLVGYNTDGEGFMLMLKTNGIQVDGRRVLLLGAGGAGRAVAQKLVHGGAYVSVFDRNAEAAASLKQDCPAITVLSEVLPADYDMVINATGIGMHKTEGMSPVGEDVLSRVGVAVDLIYVPSKSAFLSIAESLGKPVVNGRAMLFYQAYYAQCIFFGVQPDEEEAQKLFSAYLNTLYS